MRCALIALLVAACGDSGEACGHLDPLLVYQNVWSPQLALDDVHVFYSDYDVDGFGTQLVWRQPLAGGVEQPIADHRRGGPLGWGMAVDSSSLFWAAASEPTGNSLYSTPIDGGRTVELAALSLCPPRGIAVSSTHVYAGSIECEGDVARVVSVDRTTGESVIIWLAGSYDGHVQDLAVAGDVLFIGTTAALFRVDAAGTTVLDAGVIGHIEIHGDTLYYSTEEGIFAQPVAGRTHDAVYTYAPDLEDTGAFSIDGDDLYVAVPPQMLHVSLASGESIVLLENIGKWIGPVIAHDGYAYWSALVVPNSELDALGTFSGGLFRVARPCR